MPQKTKSNSELNSPKLNNIEVIINILEEGGFTIIKTPFISVGNKIYISGVKKEKGDHKTTHTIYNKMISGVNEELVTPMFFRMFVHFKEITVPKKDSDVFKNCDFLVDISTHGRIAGAEKTAQKVLFNIINIFEENKALSKHGYKIPASYSEIKIYDN